ncbi:phospholipid carrier-dependent glycosyltransferase [Kordia jejudonensis]|uniref:phospholipid carrier-dependent glycosyltransferase n=1 Tax=Kordia jejudonensis TaxID=1348245 RepID=UPI000629BEEC|nr:phospholipid carrier-dependent glycosyltransferase [Kordia jejudonensis]
MIKTFASNPKLVRIIYLLILTISFLSIYSSIFDEKVSLGGDNAHYYILGTAIADGAGYTNIQHLEKEAHYHYPPGYPLLIAGVSKLFSNDISTIKIANGFFFFGAILLLFFIIKRLTQNDHIAFAICFITLLNFHLLGYATIMMSEIPFLFFSLLSVLIFLKIDFSTPIFKNWLFFLLLICVSFSFYIRSVAVALFVSLVVFLFIKKHWRYVAAFVGGFIVLYIPWIIRGSNATGNTYVSQLLSKNPYKPELGSVGILDIWERITVNLERYITKEISSGIVSSKEFQYTDATASFAEWLLGFLVIAVVIFGVIRLKKFKTFIALYLVAFFGLLLIWPHVWYGTRFVLPLIPLLIFLFIFGLTELCKIFSLKVFPAYVEKVVPVMMTVLLIFWAFVYGYGSISKLQRTAQKPYADNYKNYFALADWVQKNTPENAVTSVRKEGLFHLFSKKYVTGYYKSQDREAQIAYLKSKQVSYVVVAELGYSSTSRYLVPAIDRYPNKFKIIKQLNNPNTYLMQFLPELGYTGTWKDEKRNGFGTYVWEDGQKYIGNWKNDVRDGQGTVFFKNGEQLSGVWQQGKLYGEVIKKDANGQIIEKSIYENNVKIKVINEVN